jgi:GNAT superfamily N-acetyltransferase
MTTIGPVYGDLPDEDLEVAAAFWGAMLVELRMQHGTLVPDWKAILVAFFREGLARGESAVFGAQMGGTIVGTAAAFLNVHAASAIFPKPSARLAGVYVLPEYRRLGIARGLTERAIAWCRTKDCAHVRLYASPMGRPLYESLGFVAGLEMRLNLG